MEAMNTSKGYQTGKIAEKYIFEKVLPNEYCGMVEPIEDRKYRIVSGIYDSIHVEWCDRAGHTSVGYDIYVKEDNVHKYVEVKARRAPKQTMSKFELSDAQLNALKKYKENYIVYLVRISSDMRVVEHKKLLNLCEKLKQNGNPEKKVIKSFSKVYWEIDLSKFSRYSIE
jgi:hypothetical protein